MSSQPLYENKHLTVPEGLENEVINYFAQFYWDLVQTQKVDYSEMNLQSEYPDFIMGTQTINVSHDRISYYTIDLRRNKRMDNYQKVVEFEEEYNNIMEFLNNNKKKPTHPSSVLSNLEIQNTVGKYANKGISIMKYLGYHFITFMFGFSPLGLGVVHLLCIRLLNRWRGRSRWP